MYDSVRKGKTTLSIFHNTILAANIHTILTDRAKVSDPTCFRKRDISAKRENRRITCNGEYLYSKYVCLTRERGARATPLPDAFPIR